MERGRGGDLRQNVFFDLMNRFRPNFQDIFKIIPLQGEGGNKLFDSVNKSRQNQIIRFFRTAEAADSIRCKSS